LTQILDPEVLQSSYGEHQYGQAVLVDFANKKRWDCT